MLLLTLSVLALIVRKRVIHNLAKRINILGPSQYKMTEQILEDSCCYRETAERVGGGQVIRLYSRLEDSSLKLICETFDSDADGSYAKRENLSDHYARKNKIWDSNHTMKVGNKTVKTKHGRNKTSDTRFGSVK